MYKTLVFQHINNTGARVTGHVVRQGGPSSGVIDQGRGQVDTIKDASALVTLRGPSNEVINRGGDR